MAALPGLEVREARGFGARLIGLAGLAAAPRGLGLLLPGTRSAHTFGMRFDLDVVWLDRSGGVVRVDHRVPPAWVRSCRRAAGCWRCRAATPPTPASRSGPLLARPSARGATVGQ